MTAILRYNWPAYVAALATVAAVAGLRSALPLAAPAAALLDLAAGAAAFWALASLAVSYCVYDRPGAGCSGVLALACRPAPRRWVALHAGLDGASEVARALFPGSVGLALDLYDAEAMPAGSIARARAGTPRRGVPARIGALPLADGRADAAFLLFVAHEVRDARRRARLFRDLAAALAPDGTIVVVEHPRDLWNALAFGPGCLHFLPRRAWLEAAAQAGLRVVEEHALTPFGRGFVMRRPGAGDRGSASV